MSKTGIVAYILAAIFIGFCFWIVGCSTDDCSSTEMPTQGGEYKSENCVVEFTQDTAKDESMKIIEETSDNVNDKNEMNEILYDITRMGYKGQPIDTICEELLYGESQQWLGCMMYKKNVNINDTPCVENICSSYYYKLYSYKDIIMDENVKYCMNYSKCDMIFNPEENNIINEEENENYEMISLSCGIITCNSNKINCVNEIQSKNAANGLGLSSGTCNEIIENCGCTIQ